ncbi:hypothetical protein PV325_006054 [Microctonus aethiopoides]|uniref:NADH dehydrogenase [ubiquinone] 1 beta subcomplex subunit 7 n=1 Tax=Microctonus aethiopoides TaxID=144406 RepID=A0AA39FW54_9HYME|nr:hypothetical protein PV325_006054 [Microctonus aethiopoides]KAK0085837.1 hypothetical protein PV326_005774 [Microctonus aethiopoides]KAK0176758.1 hypothetical protein PV328_000864 [Microctonus aethiopoides]
MGVPWSSILEPDVTPVGDTEPTFDPLYGFPKGRKPRVMVATEQEMIAAQVPRERRDYCAHHYINLQRCRVDVMPWTIKCGREKHAWDLCYYEDYVLRMKEYERERRLLVRKKRKEEKQKQAIAA